MLPGYCGFLGPSLFTTLFLSQTLTILLAILTFMEMMTPHQFPVSRSTGSFPSLGLRESLTSFVKWEARWISLLPALKCYGNTLNLIPSLIHSTFIEHLRCTKALIWTWPCPHGVEVHMESKYKPEILFNLQQRLPPPPHKSLSTPNGIFVFTV